MTAEPEQSEHGEDAHARSRRLRLVAVGAVIVVVTAAAGFLLGRRDGEARAESKEAPSRHVRSGPFALDVPEDWREPAEPVVVPGLALADRVEYSPPSGGPNGTMTVGVGSADDGSLLPATLVPHPRPSGAVRLANLQALRYDRLQPLGGDRPIEVYAVPTGHGVLTAVCAGTDPGFLRSCRAAVATLRLTSGERFALGPDRRLRSALDRAMRHLNRVRRRRAAAMGSARRPETQAAAAKAIAGAYAVAIRRVGQASRNPASAEARTWLVSTLRKAETAWSRLAVAAGEGNEAYYPLARAVVLFSEHWAGLAITHAGRSATAAPSPPVPTAPEPAPPVQAAALGPCDDTHPAYGRVPDAWKGFAKLCANDDGTSVRVTNISNVVLVVEHDGRTRHVSAPPRSLSGLVTTEFARNACLGGSCHLYPETSVQIDADRAVRVDFTLAFNDTLAVGAARAIAGELEKRLTPAEMRRIKGIYECATGVVGTFRGGASWEEVVREAAPTVPDCAALADEFRKPRVQKVPAIGPLTLTDAENIATGSNSRLALTKTTTLTKNPTLTKSLGRANDVLGQMKYDLSLRGLKFLLALR